MLSSQMKNEINKFSIELKLMILLATKEIEKREEVLIKNIIEEVSDWALFLEIVKQNKTYPIVYKNIIKFQESNIPEYVFNNLQQLVRKNTMNSLKFTGELIHVINLMKKKDIRAISLKGPLLGIQLYGENALRTSRDLDILIDCKDIEKVEEILLAIGYERFYPDFCLSTKQRNSFIKNGHHFAYHNHKLNLHLEIHWRYNFSNISFDFEQIWRRRKETSISGNEIATLSKEENFLYLANHGANHGWFRLKWLCDVYEIIKSDQLDWKVVREKGEEFQIVHTLLQCLLLVHFIFKLDIPDIFNKDIQNNGRVYRLVQMALPFIETIEEEPGVTKAKLYIHSKIYMFKLLYGIKNKLKCVSVHIYPIPNDFKTIQLKDSLFPLYFVLRPFLWLYRLCIK